MRRNILLDMLALVALGLAGCSLASNETRPKPPVPDSFPKGPAYPAATAGVSGGKVADLPWKSFFTDEKLRKVVGLAIAGNQDLRIAAVNVERARALYGVQHTRLYPSVDATASARRSRTPGDLSGTGTGTTSTSYSVDLASVAWEIDLFGRIKHLSEAALETFFATREARRGAQILLVSEVAGTYLTLAADRDELRLAESTLSAQSDALGLVRHRVERGIASELDLHFAETQVDAARRSVALFTQLVAQDENALNFLAGGEVRKDLLPKSLDDVSAPKEISAGISSSVLLKRPDVLAAEHQLKAADANIAAARAAFFPRITLTGAAGTASKDLSGLFRKGSGAWSFGPQIVMPIFDLGVRSALEVTKAERDLAVAQYQRAIQTSFREVADALAVRGTIGRQLAAQQAFTQAVSQSYRLSRLRYEKGVDSYLTVLDAQRSLFAAQQDLISLRLTKLTNQIRLYEVLGGGAATPPAAADSPRDGLDR